MTRKIVFAAALLAAFCVHASAQKYKYVDKTVAVIGNEAITLSDLEDEIKNQNAQGLSSDRNKRCELLESIMESKLFLMQAKIDSLTVNNDQVESMLSNQMDRVMTYLGGEENVEKYFGKPLYRLRLDWRQQYQDMSLTQQEQQQIMNTVPDMTPHDVKEYLDTVDKDNLPVVPIKYKLSQICIYPDREAANLAVREKLLGLRERILNGEKFSTLARIYSEDPGSARRGGELGMASKSIF